MNRGDFFKRIIDEYLFLDLKNMAELRQKDSESAGAASYPILAACVSAIELLGGLLYSENYNHHKDKVYFIHYWNEYLVVINSSYQPYADLFWRLVRNGVAHTYIAKAAITVTKGNRDQHLVIHNDGQRFNIDCQAFYEDFLKSYEKLVRPKLRVDDAFTRQVDKNIDLLITESNILCQEVLAPLIHTKPSTNTAQLSSRQTPSGMRQQAESTTNTTTMIPESIRHTFVGQEIISSGVSMLTQKMAKNLQNAKIITTKKI